MERTASLSSIVPYAVTMSVQDIDASARWYVEKLGFREVQRKNYPEFKTSLVFLELNGYRVELIQDGNATSGATRPDPPAHTATYGISQFAFRTTDLSQVRAELVQRSVPIVWEFENSDLGARFLFIRDVNGNLIQFLQSLKG
jgi:catechol 2,3-dioxygenase-like lactoylglutathione lyase family enzyme